MANQRKTTANVRTRNANAATPATPSIRSTKGEDGTITQEFSGFSDFNDEAPTVEQELSTAVVDTDALDAPADDDDDVTPDPDDAE